jgi:hypothetical protein
MKTQEFGAFIQCYKSPYATYKCLESFRKFYPDNTIVILSDNGYDYTEMSKYFNCIYIHSYENVPLCNKYSSGKKYIENVNKIITRFETAFNLISEDYVMWLEDDVSINNRISDIFMYDINGFCPNKYDNSMIKKLSEKYDFINEGNIYAWGGHGGSVFHRKNILKYFENKEIINDVLINWYEYIQYHVICHDFLISLIVNLNKGNIGSYSGHYDGYNGLNTDIIVQHQYKVWYNIPLPDNLKHLIKEKEEVEEVKEVKEVKQKYIKPKMQFI